MAMLVLIIVANKNLFKYRESERREKGKIRRRNIRLNGNIKIIFNRAICIQSTCFHTHTGCNSMSFSTYSVFFFLSTELQFPSSLFFFFFFFLFSMLSRTSISFSISISFSFLHF